MQGASKTASQAASKEGIQSSIVEVWRAIAIPPPVSMCISKGLVNTIQNCISRMLLFQKKYGASYRGDSHGVSPSQFGTRIELNKWQRPPAAIKGIAGIAV